MYIAFVCLPAFHPLVLYELLTRKQKGIQKPNLVQMFLQTGLACAALGADFHMICLDLD